jgi:hypothetical protein
MTPLALYQFAGRVCMFLFGCCLLWAAIFFVVIALLHYEPVQTPMPKSRRGRFGLPVLWAAMGGAALVGALKIPSEEFTTSQLTVFGCMSPIMVLCCVFAAWNTSFELRNAFRLRRQQHQQHTADNDHPHSNEPDR